MSNLKDIVKVTNTQYKSLTPDANSIYLVDQEEKIQPNLIINSNFKINQRGNATYNTANKYCYDRWLLSGGSVTYNHLAGKVVHTATTAWTGLYYIFPNPAELAGKKIAITIFGSGSSLRLYLADNFMGFNHKLGGYNIESSTLNTYTFIVNIPSYITNEHKLFFQAVSSTANSTFELYWVKAEIGDHFTGYQVPDPAIELSLCQSYCMRFGYNSFYAHCVNRIENGHVVHIFELPSRLCNEFPDYYMYSTRVYSVTNPTTVNITYYNGSSSVTTSSTISSVIVNSTTSAYYSTIKLTSSNLTSLTHLNMPCLLELSNQMTLECEIFL